MVWYDEKVSPVLYRRRSRAYKNSCWNGGNIGAGDVFAYAVWWSGTVGGYMRKRKLWGNMFKNKKHKVFRIVQKKMRVRDKRKSKIFERQSEKNHIFRKYKISYEKYRWNERRHKKSRIRYMRIAWPCQRIFGYVRWRKEKKKNSRLRRFGALLSESSYRRFLR